MALPNANLESLGASGLKISKIILGCMSYGSKKWADWVEDDEEKILTTIKAAYDAGIRTFDTANVYSGGLSEILVGKFIKRYNIPREKLVIISKVYFLTGDPESAVRSQDLTSVEYINQYGLSRRNIFDSVAASVKRLGTNIDVLLIHRYDHDTPPAETMEALHDIVKSGSVHYIGASSMRAFEFIRLQHIAEINKWTKFIAMENLYNLVYREEEREMIPYCKESGVGLIPWAPLAGGLLARPLGSAPTTRSSGSPHNNILLQHEPTREILTRVAKIAEERSVGLVTVALAWAIAKGTNPIVGISSPERIPDIVAAVKFKLTDDEIKHLEEPYQPQPEYGI